MLVYREFAPTTGHEHYHIYCQFTNSVTLKFEKFAGHAWAAECRGSPQQNVAYVSKDGDRIEEYGILAKAGRLAMTVSELRECPVDDCPAMLYNIKQRVDSMDRHIDWQQWITRPKVQIKVFSTKFELAGWAMEKGLRGDLVEYDGKFWNGATDTGEVAVCKDYGDAERLRETQYLNLKGFVVPNNYKWIAYVRKL